MIECTPEITDRICTLLIEGKSIRQIAEIDGFPSRSTLLRWLRDDADFEAKCTRARDVQAMVMDDRIMEVAEKVENGSLDAKAGSVVISAFQWRASKLAPKKYGERIQQELTGKDGGPLQIVSTIPRPKLTDGKVIEGE